MSEQSPSNPPSNEPVVEAPQKGESNVTQPPAAPPQTPAAVQELRFNMDRDKHLRAREAQLKQKEQELARLADLPKRFQEKPLEVLQELGVPYDSLVKRVHQGERPDPVAPVNQKLAALEQEIREMREREAQSERQVVVERARAGVQEFISKTEDLPLLRELNASDMVFDLVQQHQAAGNEAKLEDVAREVETYLSGLVEKVMKSESLRSRFLPAPPAQETPHLSNADASSVSSRPSLEEDGLSFEERVRQAAAGLKWKSQ